MFNVLKEVSINIDKILASMESDYREMACQQTKSTPPLPIEIVNYIMKFLPLTDRIAASQVCRLWYLASQDQKLHENEVIVLCDELVRPMKAFENSSRVFINFVFKEVELTAGGRMVNFWQKFGPSIRTLSIHSCDVSEKNFVEILFQCPNLEVLNLNGCRELLMSGKVLENEAQVIYLSKMLCNLRELSLACNRYLSDMLFNRFVTIAPNLETLSLTGCQISYHSGIYRKFYPSHLKSVPSESVLTFHNILQYLQTNAYRIRSLSFGHTLLDNLTLTKLAQVPQLRLASLNLQSCDQLTKTGIVTLVEHQKYLTELDLSLCSRMTDHSLLAICQYLESLVTLKMRRCRGISDIGVSELHRLKKLRCLDLSQCEGVTSEGIEKGLCTCVLPQFRRLNVSSLLLDEQVVLKLARCLPELTHFDLGSCINAVTDESLQAICKHQVKLRSLKFMMCDKITDSGLTGKGMAKSQVSESNASQHEFKSKDDLDEKNSIDIIMRERLAPGIDVINLEEVCSRADNSLHKISLRTRAEQEIVKDAKRKKVVLQLCEDQLGRGTGISLVRLKGLRELDLHGCNRITDVSIKHAFRFLELQHLNLSHCQQVTDLGLAYLGINNPSLETLILSHCYNITDTGIASLVKCLSRLRYFDVQNCKQLSDLSLEAIGDNCCDLKYLDISECHRMTVESSEQVEKNLPWLNTLHRRGLSKKNNNVQRCGPAPPPIPPVLTFSLSR